MLSRLAAKCRDCPFVENCNNKRMDALAYFTEPADPKEIVDMTELYKSVYGTLVSDPKFLLVSKEGFHRHG